VGSALPQSRPAPVALDPSTSHASRTAIVATFFSQLEIVVTFRPCLQNLTMNPLSSGYNSLQGWGTFLGVGQS
jgi:hypothetical protein